MSVKVRAMADKGAFIVTTVLSLLLLICLIRVFTGNRKDTRYEDLLSTGGAIRRSLPLNIVSQHTTVCDSKECKKIAKYVKRSMNTSVDPCENFYDFACGGWIGKNPIPKTSSSFSTFAKLNSEVEKALRKIIEDKTGRFDNKYMKKAKTFYKSCMDLKSIDKLGAKPLFDVIRDVGSSPLFDKGHWNEKKWNLQQTLLKLQKKYASAGGPLFSVHVSNDPRHNQRHILEIDQAGPSLSREVYFDNKKIIRAYTEFMIDVAVALGTKRNHAEKQAKDLVEFEKKLAKISVPSADKTDTWFNQMTMKELTEKLPQFPWKDYIQDIFSHIKIMDDELVIIPALPYLKKFGNITKSTSKTVLSNYVVWNVIQDEIPHLSKKFRDIRNNYKNKVMGSRGQRKRWKICVSMTNDFLGDVIGEAYSRKYFDKEKKDLARKMIVNIRQAFQENVDGLKWMDNSTIDAVQDKANAMRDQVGYPNYYDNDKKYKKRFRKYDKVEFKADTLFANKMALLKMSHQRMLKKLRKPVDKEEWPLDPQTINAMYSFNENQMVIPAGILQPPFFHGVKAPRAMLYGAIGAILGHELTHGFDNTGRKFNKHGELTKNWWGAGSLKHFKKRADCVEKQYGAYKVRGKYPLNGKLTLGENIADNGGFRASQKGYHNWLKKNNEITLPSLNFTNEQLFYISFAQSYCSHSRATQDYLATLTDPHSDEIFRVKGVLSNSKEFSRAFNCPLGSEMNPKTKCAVWISDQVIVDDETRKLLPITQSKEKGRKSYEEKTSTNHKIESATIEQKQKHKIKQEDEIKVEKKSQEVKNSKEKTEKDKQDDEIKEEKDSRTDKNSKKKKEKYKQEDGNSKQKEKDKQDNESDKSEKYKHKDKNKEKKDLQEVKNSKKEKAKDKQKTRLS